MLFIWLIWFIWLVSFNQAHETDRTDHFPASYNGTMLAPLARQPGYVDIVEKSLNRYENHRGICRPVSRTMPVSMLNS